MIVDSIYRVNTFYRILAFCLLVLSHHSILQPQTNSKIYGNIIDAETLEPIPYANIYISKSSIGTASDRAGYFEIRNIPPGRYEIIASVLGYEVLKANVRVFDNSTRNFRFEMYKHPIEMEEVVVRGKVSRKRRRQLNQFRRGFLGSSQNGKKSYIANEEVLRFEQKGDMLIAYAYEPLKIVNNGLGYKILYILDEYQQTPDLTKYNGYPYFFEQTTTTYHDSIDWPENRKNTYLGSLRHFLTTICENHFLTNGDTAERPFKLGWDDVVNNRTKMIYADENHVDKEGFYVTNVKYLRGNIVTSNVQLVNTNWYLSESDSENEMYFAFDNYLYVKYDKEYYPFNSRNFQNKARSWISLNCDSTVLDKQGRYFDIYAIRLMGVWSKERVADMLPFDYMVSE